MVDGSSLGVLGFLGSFETFGLVLGSLGCLGVFGCYFFSFFCSLTFSGLHAPSKASARTSSKGSAETKLAKVI